ncbi:MAG: EscT/YscT/HrcT family type III secretion system export apparatus protein [Chlamydiales bacterium]
MTAPSDTYVSYLLSRPLPEVWNIFLLGLARLAPAISLAPFLGGKTLPASLNLGLSISVVFIFLPFLVVHTSASMALDITFLLFLIKEVIIGAMLGFIIAIPFYFAQGAGALIDHQRGAQSLQVMDPSTQMQTSATGIFYNDMMLITFFFIGGPIIFFDGVFESYRILPIDKFFPPQFFRESYPFWVSIFGMITTVLTITLQLCSPSLISMLLSDLFLGIANRMAPQVQISFLLWAFKAFVGIAMLWASWWLVFRQLDVQAISWIKVFQKMIQQLNP